MALKKKTPKDNALLAPMNSTEFNSILEGLDIGQQQFARIFKLGGRTPKRYASGESEIPGSMAIVLRMLKSGKLSLGTITGGNDA